VKLVGVFIQILIANASIKVENREILHSYANEEICFNIVFLMPD
jgi:hypothetical protein